MKGPITVSLEAVLDAVPVGIGVIDADRRIVMMNPAFHASLDLPRDAFPPGTPVVDAVRASALRGVYGPGDPEAQVAAIMAADHTKPGRLRRRTFGGRSFELYNTPLSGGAYVVSAVETTSLLTERAAAEVALTQTTNALIAMRIGIAIFDDRRNLLFANPRFSALLAIPSDRLVVGSSFDTMLSVMEARDEYVGPDGQAFVAALRGTAFRWAAFPGAAFPGSAFPGSDSMRRRRADGRSIDVMFDPIQDGGCMIAVHDVTPQAQAEDDAKRRARLLDLVLVNVPHGICVYGPDHRVTMFNDTYIKVMAGASVEVGDSRQDIIRRRAEAGEFGQGDLETLVAAQAEHTVSRPEVRRRMRPNGTAIDIRVAPMPDGGHINVVTDVTALVQAEAALRQRAEDMGTMLGNIRHGIMLWGADARLVASNPVTAEFLNLSPEMLSPGRPDAEVIGALSQGGHFGSQAEFAPVARNLQKLDRSVPFSREVVSKSGRVLFAESNPAPGGGWVTTLTDITRMRETEIELRRAKDLAEAANEAKSRFLGTMSHELRTPLNVIIGFSDTMARARGGISQSQVAEFSGQIHDAGRQLLSLINVILDVARIENGRIEPSGEIVRIDQAVTAAIRSTASEALAGDISVRSVIPSDLPSIRADERRIVQAISQLLSNAVKFTPSGGSVIIAAEVTGENELSVSVTDTGIGIAEANLDQVFEPFTQLDNSLSRRYPGAGLGLFMARAIVAAHGGTLRLASRVGEGTTARVILPSDRVVTKDQLAPRVD